MTEHATGTRDEWLVARLELLRAEKELTRRSDELARQRQPLPRVRIDKDYRFENDGRVARSACEPSGLQAPMGWSFPWASSLGSDFNFDFNVSFTEEQQRAGSVEYNYRSMDVRPLPRRP